jgi:hypothetical protein
MNSGTAISLLCGALAAVVVFELVKTTFSDHVAAASARRSAIQRCWMSRFGSSMRAEFVFPAVVLLLAMRHRPEVPGLLTLYVVAVLAPSPLNKRCRATTQIPPDGFPILIVPALCRRRQTLAVALPVFVMLLGLLAPVYVTPGLEAP